MFKPFHIQDRLLGAIRHLEWRPGRPSGVLLISAGGLGDTVLFSLLAPRFLQLAEDGETVTVLLRRDAAKMAFLLPPGIALEVVDFKRLRGSLGYRRKIHDRLYRAHFRLIVTTDHLRHPDLDESLIAAARPAQALAMEPRPWPKHDRALARNRALYARLFASGPEHLDKVVRWSRFADWLTGRPAPPPMVSLADASRPAPPPEAAYDVIIQPFSAVRQKQSPAALYRDLIEALPKGIRIAITGAPGDLEGNPQFKDLLELDGVSFDGASFEELAPLLRQARLVVSVDTATMHLAVAVGAPTLCLASAAYVGEIVPYAPEITPANANFIYREMDCQGCLGACIHAPVDGMYPCVAAIDRASAVDRAVALFGPA